MPNRTLRDGLRSSGPINGLSDRAHRLYTHLLLTADDFGLLEWTPAWVKAMAVPALTWELAEVERLMAELAAARLVRVYEAKGKPHAAVEKWEQRRWAKHPKFPLPPWGVEHVIGGYVAPRARDNAEEAPARPNGKRVLDPRVAELLPKVDRGTRMEIAELPDEWRTFCAEQRPDLSPEAVFERFRDYWRGVPGRRGTKLDWAGTWRNWVRSEEKGKEARPANPLYGGPGKAVM